MPGPFTPDMISILRLIALVIWSIIVLWAAPAYRRAMFGKAYSEDWKQCAIGAVGLGVISFQVRVLSGREGTGDYWTGASLLLIAFAGLMVMLFVHLPRTPSDHKRAMLYTHASIVFLCVVGGLL